MFILVYKLVKPASFFFFFFYNNILCQFQCNLFETYVIFTNYVLLVLPTFLVFLIHEMGVYRSFSTIYRVNQDITRVSEISLGIIWWICCQDISYTLCCFKTVLLMAERCTLILDELLGAHVLSLSDVTSPTCASVVPTLLLLLSSDLVVSSFLFLSPPFIAIVTIIFL